MVQKGYIHVSDLYIAEMHRMRNVVCLDADFNIQSVLKSVSNQTRDEA